MSQEKPICHLTSEDGNVFNLIRVVADTLKWAGLKIEAKEMRDRVFKCKSYDEALVIMGEYVDIR